jgi:hypothetical protein
VASVNDGKASLRMRATRKVVMAAGGEVIDDLVRRIAELEAEVQENRKVNLRVAELVDVVAELLVPLASQDQARIDAAIEKFQQAL